MAARVLVGPATSRADLVTELRRTFDLDSVGIVSRTASGWRVEASAGTPAFDIPGEAQFSAELAYGQILVMTGRGLTHSDAELVKVFCAELLLARRRAQHDELRGQRGGDYARVTPGLPSGDHPHVALVLPRGGQGRDAQN